MSVTVTRVLLKVALTKTLPFSTWRVLAFVCFTGFFAIKIYFCGQAKFLFCLTIQLLSSSCLVCSHFSQYFFLECSNCLFLSFLCSSVSFCSLSVYRKAS